MEIFFFSICVHFIRNRFCQFHGNYLVYMCAIFIYTHMCKQKISFIVDWERGGERFRALLHWFHQCSFFRKRNRILSEYFCFKAKSHVGSYGDMRVVCVCYVRIVLRKKKAIAFHILFVTVMSSIWYFIPLSLDEEFARFFHHVTDWRQQKFNENVCHFDYSINVLQRQREKKIPTYSRTKISHK